MLPPDIYALAKHFGLSRSTISYIINGKWSQRRIGAETARKVLAFIEQTGFRPNPLGTALKGKPIKDTAVLIPVDPYDHLKDAYFRLLTNLHQAGAGVLVLPITNDNLNETAQFLKMYRVKQVVVFAAGIMRSENQEAWREVFDFIEPATVLLYDFPFERLDPSLLLSNSPRSAAIGIDRSLARQMAIQAMLDGGYRVVLLPQEFGKDWQITIPDGVVALSYSIHRENDWTLADWGRIVAGNILRLMENGVVPAAFVPDDKLSWSVIRALRTSGVRVPSDLALCSWDGLLESELFSPALTTVVFPHAEMLATVMTWLSGALVPQRLLLQPLLRIGETLPKHNSV